MPFCQVYGVSYIFPLFAPAHNDFSLCANLPVCHILTHAGRFVMGMNPTLLVKCPYPKTDVSRGMLCLIE